MAWGGPAMSPWRLRVQDAMMQESMAMDRRQKEGFEWQLIPVKARQQKPIKQDMGSKAPQLDAPWICKTCGTWHRNPTCVNCRSRGEPRAKQAIAKQHFAKPRPWQRREGIRKNVGATKDESKTGDGGGVTA
eukprot:7417530-Alexandrium_andersonii.AAC.1